MSELAKRDPNQWETSIERFDKKLTCQLGDKAIVFTMGNTMMYEHAEEYRQFDHIYRVNDKGDSGAYYLRDDQPRLWDRLTEETYPRLVRYFPTPDDERIIMGYFDNQIQNNVDELLRGSDE